MTNEEYWDELVADVLVELSPRSDVEDIVNAIWIEDFHGEVSCTARVNATVWIDDRESVQVSGQTVTAESIRSTGLGEQKLFVEIEE